MSSAEHANLAAPVVCLYAADVAALRAAAAALRELPWVVMSEALGVPSTDSQRALVEAVKRRPGRDILLLSADVRLPEFALERLHASLQGAPWADLVTVLDPECAVLDPRPAGVDWLNEALDSACWALADAEYPEILQISDRLQLWRGEAAQLRALGQLAEPRIALQPRLCLPPGLRPAEETGSPMLPVAALRTRLAQRLPLPMTRAGLDGRPVVLHLLHAWGGGAERFVRDLAASDAERCHIALIASSDSSSSQHGHALALHLDLAQSAVRVWPLAAPTASTALANEDYRAILQGVVRDWRVSGVVLNSLVGHSLDGLRSGLPTAVVCHDYYPAWPVLHADFGAANFDASDAGLVKMLSARGADPLFRSRDPQAWLALRQAWLAALESVDPILIAPSRSVRENLCRMLPALAERRWFLIPHGLEPLVPVPVRAAGSARRGLRVLVPGRLNGGKGEDLIAELLPILPDGVELVLLGSGRSGMRFFGNSRVHLLMDYQRDELPGLIAGIAPDVALLASTVAETFSYTLSEMWALHVPVIATRLGSFAERIDHGRTGLLVEPMAKVVAACLADLIADRGVLEALDRGAAASAVVTLEAMVEAHREAFPLQPQQAAVEKPNIPLLRDLQQAQLDEAHLHARLRRAERLTDDQQLELARRSEWAYGLDRQLRERSAWADSLQQEVERSRASLSELREEFEARSRWALSLQAEAVELEQRATGLLAELAQSEAAHAQTEAAHAHARAQAEAALASAQRESEELQRYVDSLISQRDEFETERNQILNSASWKLTKPLRFVRRLMAGAMTRMRYRLQRVAALSHRVSRSLKVRGMNGTVARIKREFEGVPASTTILQMPPEQAFEAFALACADEPRVSIVIPVYNHIEATLTCLRSILADVDERVPFEVITVDDGSSDASAEQLPQIDGLHYVRNPQNLGFIGACNAGAAVARGAFLIFLNNDTAVQPGWLDALIDTFDQHPRAGLVGSKLVYPDGRLQEAGGIVFADGSGWNYGRFEDPADPRFNYLREVDYCSGAAIAIRKSLFDELGGFDSHYAPAYYEDTDLAMKVRMRGLSVLYQPASVVVHYEGVTSGTDTASGIKAYQVVNQQKFLQRWSGVLATHAAPGTDIAIAREHRAARRVLVIDATTPQPDQDSGSLRLVNILRLLRERGDAVSFFADNRAFVDGYSQTLQQLGVEVLWHPWLSDPVGWFAQNAKRFDAFFVCRHYVASIYLPLVRQHAPRAQFIFDTVDLHYLREQRAAALSGREDLARAAAETRDKELRLIRESDVSVVVSPVEQELLSRDAPGARVEVLSNVHEVFGRRRDFAERKDVMFIGGFQHPPNIDAAEWFVREIWPLVRAELPELCFHLIGSKATAAVRALGEAEGVVFHGFVEDIEPFLDGCRLALAPLRYGAGVKGKVNMSMSYGQPVVGTSVATEGMFVRPGIDVLVADAPSEFAARLIQAYRDEALWMQLSDNGLANVERHFSFEAAKQAIKRVIG